MRSSGIDDLNKTTASMSGCRLSSRKSKIFRPKCKRFGEVLQRIRRNLLTLLHPTDEENCTRLRFAFLADDVMGEYGEVSGEVE